MAYINGKQILNLSAAINGVASVNGKTGNVVLTAADIESANGTVEESLQNILSRLDGGVRTAFNTADVDLNTYTDAGWWYTGMDTTVTNAPIEDIEDFELIVMKTQGAAMQFFFFPGQSLIYCRNDPYGTGRWGSWEKIITEQFVDSAWSTTSTNPIQNKVVNERMNKKVWCTNGTATGAVDWNTLTTTGCYKIQNCTMTADYNAPLNEYVYGVLQVLNSENETGEHRVTQIYMPRSPQRYSLWIRTNNSATGYNNWTDWVPFNNAFQLYTKFSTKADIETGTCTLTAYSDTVFGGTVSNETLLNWESDTSKYYTTGSVNADGTLAVTGTGNALIINAYNINATGTVGVEFEVSGTGAIKIEIKGGGTTYTSGDISLSTNTQKIQITHATSGIAVLDGMEINIYASGETALKIENLLKMTEASTRTLTGTYDLIGNQVTVSVFVDNLQNSGEIALYPLPFVPKIEKSGVCGVFGSSPYSAIYYDIDRSTTAMVYLNDEPQAYKQLTFYYTV